MLIKGKYNEAKIFTKNVDETTLSQVYGVLNNSFSQNSKIRIMSDCHAGAGCVIGTTMTIEDKVVPNLVGVDIGCGIKVVKFNKDIHSEEFDRVVQELIPSGFNVRNCVYKKATKNIREVRATGIDFPRAELSLGTLGGGNHFIEIDKDDEGNSYLLVHSGSRQFGLQIADYYQKLAISNIKQFDIKAQIDELKARGEFSLINDMIAKEKEKRKADFNKDLAYLTGQDKEDYLHDMKIATAYAQNNRDFIAEQLVKAFDIDVKDEFTTVHNYIGEDNILRKGAVSARENEILIIPMNMRDGSLICMGKGNEDWNYSAPHGAGRILSRSKAKKLLKLQDFKDTMEEVYSTSICANTLDEAPMVYKPMDEIIENIYPTVNVVSVIKPIYNYKAH